MKQVANNVVGFAKERPIATIGIAASILALIGLGIKAAVSDKKSP